MNPERFHLTLTSAGRRIAEGWWRDETVARGRFTAWVGDFGKPGARITLVDEDEQQTLAEWPDES